MRTPRWTTLLGLALSATILATGCSGSTDAAPSTTSSSTTSSTSTSSSTTANSASTSTPTTANVAQGDQRKFQAEIWADNWSSLSINGKLVGEDSVPITTERSFNSETFTFEASYPFTIGMITKDFKENDTGLEYIGTDRQQMGDGGFIVQITDTSTGKIVATTGADWRGLVIQRAPLDVACEKSTDPTSECTSKSSSEPSNWAEASFDDSTWTTATVYTAADVDPKDGYSSITWDPTAAFIWSESLTQDNTILWRHVVEGP